MRIMKTIGSYQNTMAGIKVSAKSLPLLWCGISPGHLFFRKETIMETVEKKQQGDTDELLEFVKGLSHKEKLGLLCILRILIGTSEEEQKSILEAFQQQKEKELSPGWVSGYFVGMAFKKSEVDK